MLSNEVRAQVWHMMGQDREQFGKFMYAYYAGVYGAWINPLATAEETGPSAKPIMRKELNFDLLRWLAEEHPRVCAIDWAAQIPETPEPRHIEVPKPRRIVRRTASSCPRGTR